MPGHDTLTKQGGWTVELINPIGDVDIIDLKSPTLDVVVRWGNGGFTSTLSLLSTLSGRPESILAQLTYPDVDRVLLALFNIVPPNIKEDLQAGKLPLATPNETERLPEKRPSQFPWPESAAAAREWPREEPKTKTPESSPVDDGALSVVPPEVMKARA